MDLHHAARAVQGAPRERREAACFHLIWRAHVADKYVKRLQKLHPLWGDGSLRAAALADLDGMAHWIMSPDILDCFALVSRVLVEKERADTDR